jgi:NAD(P)-dependent dehydrogenase (short-subunit alcohol dehydrogenase family)
MTAVSTAGRQSVGVRPAPGRPARDRRLILVTGASTGIGEATVLRLAALGYRVLAGVRRAEDAARLQAAAPNLETILLDITSGEHLANLAERLALEPGGIGGLVNNAGTVTIGPVEKVSTDAWRQAFETNVIGTVAVTKAALEGLIQAKGRVVNVSSPTGRVALPLFGAYSATKFALEGFNDTLRREIGPLGVHVICVQPGAIATPLFDKGIDQADAMVESAPPQLVERYANLIDSARRAAADGAENGRPPAAAAGLIVKALTTRFPRTRYGLGLESRAASTAARLLPDSALDALFARLAAH